MGQVVLVACIVGFISALAVWAWLRRLHVHDWDIDTTEEFRSIDEEGKERARVIREYNEEQLKQHYGKQP